jgi:hypothetical protein
VRTRGSTAAAPPPIVATTHRGRIQVQGHDMPNPEPSFSWTRPGPLPKREALAELNALETGCTVMQRRLRDRAFERARDFVQRGPYLTLAKPINVHFWGRSSAICKNARVDIEIVRGEAFV